jgi:hypothetical protein
MSHENDRAALRKKLVRLLNGLDFYRTWRVSSLKIQYDDISEQDLVNQVVMSGAYFLKLFDQTKGNRCKEVIKEVSLWYSHASSELNYFASLSEKDRYEVQKFLDDFKKVVGFSFHAEAGTLKKIANRALKRGKITDEREYYMLNEVRIDLSQTILNAEEQAEISQMLQLFEDGLQT